MDFATTELARPASDLPISDSGTPADPSRPRGKNGRNSLWTPELKAEVVRLWNKCSAESIAAQLRSRGLNVSRNAVIGLLYRAGKTGNGLPAEAQIRKNAPPRNPGRPFGPRQSPRERIADEVVQLRCAEIVPLNATVESVKGCRWPYGDGPFTFCDHPRADNHPSYCPAHRLLSISERLVENAA